MLSGWHEWPGYSERERAALEWTEAVTLLTKDRVPDDVIRFGLLRQSHDNALRTDDPGLLPCDFAHCISKKFLMIERNIGNHAHSWFNYVRRIQPPTHADFEDRNLHLLAREVQECDGRHHLEEARMPRQCRILD